MKNLKSDLWQNLLSPLKARTHLHNVDDYYYHGDGDKRQALDVLTDSGERIQDIIPFAFNFYTPGEGDTDKFLYFRALLDSMSDSYTANWAGIKYVGRAEEFFNYTGFSRTFSFAFKAAAFSKKQLYPIYRK